MNQEAIDFADNLLSDFEIVVIEGELLWQLAGTNQNYTSKQLFKIWIDSKEKVNEG